MAERDLGQSDLDSATDPVPQKSPEQLARDLDSGPRTMVPKKYDAAALTNVTIAPPKLGVETIVMEMLGLSKLAEIAKKRNELMGSETGEKSAKRFIFGEGHEFSEEVLTQALLAANKEVFNAFLALDEIPIKLNNGSDDDSGADFDNGRKKRKSRLSPMQVIDASGNKELLEKAISINPQKAFELKAPLLAQMGLTKPDGGALKRYNEYLNHIGQIALLGSIPPEVPPEFASECRWEQISRVYLILARIIGIDEKGIKKISAEDDKKKARAIRSAIESKASTLTLEQLSELVKNDGAPWRVITSVRQGLEEVFQDENIIPKSVFDREGEGELTKFEGDIFSLGMRPSLELARNVFKNDAATMEDFIVGVEESYRITQYYKARLEQLRQILKSLFSKLREIDEKHSL